MKAAAVAVVVALAACDADLARPTTGTTVVAGVVEEHVYHGLVFALAGGRDSSRVVMSRWSYNGAAQSGTVALECIGTTCLVALDTGRFATLRCEVPQDRCTPEPDDGA